MRARRRDCQGAKTPIPAYDAALIQRLPPGPAPAGLTAQPMGEPFAAPILELGGTSTGYRVRPPREER